MKKAAIDLGTNTCLLLIEGGDQKILTDQATVVRLGEGLDVQKIFSQAAMDRTLECLRRYLLILKKENILPHDVRCVATASARNSNNSKIFFEKIKNDLGLIFQTITGEQEAELTFLGALLPEMDSNSTLVLDIGGGSTEFVSSDGKISLNIGSVNLTERFLLSNPVTDKEFWSCQSFIDTEIDNVKIKLNKYLKGSKIFHLCGVAGTVTALGAWFLRLDYFQAEKIEGLALTVGDVHRMLEELKWRTIDERKQLPSVEEKRADVLLAGTLILWRTMEKLGFSKIYISTRGLRYGVLDSRGKLILNC